jgi:hypothetical protein
VRAHQLLVEGNPGTRPEQLVSAHIVNENSKEGVVGDAEFFQLARDPTILDLVSDVIGPDIVLW